MLKLKDEIDLQDLKKYGFEYDKNRIETYNLRLQDNLYGNVEIRITQSRIVYPIVDLDYYNLGNINEFKIYDILFDMIKDDVIEKVGNYNIK